MGQRKLVNIRIDSDLWHSAKIEALKQNKTLQEYVEEALREKLGNTLCHPEKTG